MVEPSILIVDDDDSLRAVLAAALQRDGHAVYAARSGEDGLAVLCERRPTILLTDLNMPGMTGWELIEAAQALASADRRALDVVVLTASGGTNEAHRALEAGVAEFLLKPFHVRSLRVVVRRLLARQELVADLRGSGPQVALRG